MTRLVALVQKRVDEEGQAQFAERIGVGIGVVRSLLAGRDIKASNLHTLCAAVGLDIILKDHAEPVASVSAGTPIGDYVFVRHLGAKVSAGRGKLVESEAVEGVTAFAREWFTRRGASPDNAVMVQAHGDSMIPTITDGAWVVVDGGARAIDHKGIYCFRRGDEIFVKRLLPSGRSPSGQVSALVIVADNPQHDVELVAGPDLLGIVIIGRVLATFTEL